MKKIRMNRFPRLAVLAGCAALLFAAPRAFADEKPNILFILIDDMGWKDIGCAGSAYYKTPHIDRLASEGIRFLNAYSAAPVCTPSRGAIFSGKYPARTKLTTVFKGLSGPDDRLHDKSKYSGEQDQVLEARHRHVLPKTEILLARALAEGGYATGFFGKWHIGECPGYYPDERGFQVAKGYRRQQVANRSHWMKKFLAAGVNLEGADPEAYVADVLAEECADFISENKAGPWLAVLSHYLVHSPVQPKPDKLARYENAPTADQKNPGYASMVESVDDTVGRVLRRIEELGLERNTLVIFTSDNGGLTPRNTSNYPLMGGKSFPFEAGMKVPLIVKWPERIQPGLSEQRVVGTDFYPTMLSAAGLPLRPEQHVDGMDLMPVLEKGAVLKPRPIIFHFPHYTHATGPFSSIIQDDWKLIRFYNDAEGAWLLYNLASDPEEQTDLAATNPEMVDRLNRRLSDALLEMEAELPAANPAFDPAAKGKRYNLEYTKSLAEKERLLFEERLRNP
jgi:arylsulfatase A